MTSEELALVEDFLTAYEAAGLIERTGSYSESGLPLYRTTDKGEQWVKERES